MISRRRRARALLVAAAILAALAPIGSTGREDVGARTAQGAEPKWARHPILSGPVSDVAVDIDGVVWARRLRTTDSAIDARDPLDIVAGIGAAGDVRFRGTLTAAVERRYQAVVRAGTVGDVWAVDAAGRVWIGARYFDGRGWTVVGRDETGPNGAFRYDARALVDASGLVWVPFVAEPACPGSDPCDNRGMASFDTRGRREVVTFKPAYEADALGLATVHLLAGRPAVWAAARAQLYRPPSTLPIEYPLLGPPTPGSLRNAGYAGAAAVAADGMPDVFTWVELQTADGVSYRILRNHWVDDAGAAWETPEDLTDSPLFGASARDRRPVAAAWSIAAAGAAPDLWLASSAGGVARRRAGTWDVAFEAAEIGLAPRARIRDLAVGSDGTLWLAADDGLYSYGGLDPITGGGTARAFVPWAGKR